MAPQGAVGIVGSSNLRKSHLFLGLLYSLRSCLVAGLALLYAIILIIKGHQHYGSSQVPSSVFVKSN